MEGALYFDVHQDALPFFSQHTRWARGAKQKIGVFSRPMSSWLCWPTVLIDNCSQNLWYWDTT